MGSSMFCITNGKGLYLAGAKFNSTTNLLEKARLFKAQSHAEQAISSAGKKAPVLFGGIEPKASPFAHEKELLTSKTKSSPATSKESSPAASSESRKQVSMSERSMVYVRTHGRCAYCGELLDFDNFTVDHIHPRSRGGINHISNMFAACQKCNQLKGSATLDEFRRLIEDQVQQVCKEISVAIASKNAHVGRFIQHSLRPIAFYFERMGTHI